MLVRGLVCTLLFCGMALPVCGQINVERLRTNSQKAGYDASLGLDFNVLTGNSDKLELSPRGRLDYTSDYWNWFLVGHYKYGESAQQAFANKGFIHWRVYAPLATPGLFWEFFTQKEFDEFRRITDRFLFGLGVRSLLVSFGPDEKTGRIYMGSSLMAERETYTSRPASDLLRWTNYLVCSYNQDTLSFVTIWYLQPVLSDFGNLRAMSDTTLGISITKHVSWQISAKLNYHSRPQNLVQTHDLEIQNGISWNM